MRARGESGAVAVLFAICCFILFAVSALAVDLGNAFVRKRDVQSQADFAALSAGAKLGASNAKLATDPAVQAAADYLNRNRPQNDAGLTTVTAAQLVDGNDLNGEVYLSGDTIRVVSPRAKVRFTLAGALGVDSTTVAAEATTGIFSPGTAVMPLFAVEGCAYGPQSIVDPAAGHVTNVTPNLYAGTDNNGMTLDKPGSPPVNPSPAKVDLNPGATTLTIKGSQLGATTKVGFFADGNTAPGPPPIEVTPSSVSNSQITVALPITGVTDKEALWWIRLWGPGSGNNPAQWSSVTRNSGEINTVPFRVGTPYLRCAGKANAGNYGSLKLPRTDTTASDWLAKNIAVGLQDPLSLKIYPGNNSSDLLCDDADGAPTVYSTTTGTPTLKKGTNCIDTDTGLPAVAVTAGMVTGLSGTPPRLKPATKAGCGTDRTVTLNSQSYKINNETLTCYFIDSPAASVADVSAETYTFNSGKPVVSAAIYSSPRFFWQPVLGQQPGTGGSLHYKIIDMRPAFLTNQRSDATKGTPCPSPATAAECQENGVVITNGAVAELGVVFLNVRAIEEPDGGPVIDWLGGNTPKLVRLIN